MNSYRITRTRLVTEVFRADANSADEAFDLIGSGDEDCDYEKISEETISSDSEIEVVESD